MSFWSKLFGGKDSPTSSGSKREQAHPTAARIPTPFKGRRVIEGHKPQLFASSSGEPLCRVFSLAASADGNVILSAAEDGNVKVWDAKTGRERLTLCSDGSQVCGVAVGADGKTAASASYWALSVWDLSNGQERQRLKKANWVGGLALSADASVIIAAS